VRVGSPLTSSRSREVLLAREESESDALGVMVLKSFVLLFPWLLLASEPLLKESEFIYNQGSYPSVHASTIAETSTGLVAAWFGGTAEKNKDVGIWCSRRVGKKWTESREVANGVQKDGTRYPTWNPVLFQPKKGPLLLFYKVGPSPREWWGELKTSIDGGENWSKARRLPQGIYGPIKNKPFELSNGDLLCPTSFESNEQHGKWSIYFEKTSDYGQTWTRTPLLHDGLQISAIQPSILKMKDGSLRAIGRTRQGRVFKIDSTNDGETWGPIALLDLPNPNAGTDALTLTNGRHLIVYNHSSRGRSPLNVAISQDGDRWEKLLELENEPGKEFSYPAVIQASDGRIHITYTWQRKKIKHVVLDLGSLILD